ncbi:MAG: extradiol ring-cleavage dioxygenase [Deltaproteobacteria bacterium]|nr:extradiol ring-cleavage dioxygenase [Deltaproteobacteria bacterium]
MGEILGIGTSHYPGPMVPDSYMAAFLRRALESSRVPEHLKKVESWPRPMQLEWADDGGTRAAGKHRERMIGAFRKIRAEIEAFKPDFILVWGDDQYENFREDIIPPFCVYIFDRAEYVPLAGIERWAKTDQNIWGEPPDKVFNIKGHVPGGRYLVNRLSQEDFDLPYAYTLRSDRGLAHSFSQTLVFLDYDRQGFDFPLVPFHVNCYGSSVIRSRGGIAHLAGDGNEGPDPPAPSPRRCFDLGRSVARALGESPWRVVLMATSSWSHAFLTEKNHWLYPDMEADRQRFEELRDGKHGSWRGLDLAQIEESGQNEILNWVCLAGAVTELNQRIEVIDYVESHVFNSNKCFALFRP